MMMKKKRRVDNICQKWASRVSLTGVLARCAGTHHIGCDLPVGISSTSVVGQDLDIYLLKYFRGTSSRGESAPTRYSCINADIVICIILWYAGRPDLVCPCEFLVKLEDSKVHVRGGPGIVTLMLMDVLDLNPPLSIRILISFMLPNLHTHSSRVAALGAVGCGHDKPTVEDGS